MSGHCHEMVVRAVEPSIDTCAEKLLATMWKRLGRGSVLVGMMPPILAHGISSATGSRFDISY